MYFSFTHVHCWLTSSSGTSSLHENLGRLTFYHLERCWSSWQVEEIVANHTLALKGFCQEETHTTLPTFH